MKKFLTVYKVYFFLAIAYIFIVSSIYVFSQKFILNSFLDIESKINIQNIESFINIIDKDIENLKNTTNDYSKWDDTYTFINTNDTNYIYENFREGTSTLEGLNIDGMIFISKLKNVLFSSYTNETLILNKIYLENTILKKMLLDSEYSTILQYQGKFFYLVKSNVLKSDDTGVCNGYIFALREVSSKSLEATNKVFSKIHISNNLNHLEYEMENSNKIKLKNIDTLFFTTQQNRKLYNNMLISSKTNQNPLLHIETISNREFIENIKLNILAFNIFTSFILLILLVLFYKYYKLHKLETLSLDEKIKRKTQELEQAYLTLKEKNKELIQLVNYDTLTKIFNRRSFFERSKDILKISIDKNLDFFVVIIDLDHFKSINDTFGHGAGDKVLIEFCEIVKDILDDKDIFARIGGEEFCITFYNKPEVLVTTICETIRKRVENTPIKYQENTINLTISMGLASRGDLTQIDAILHNADELLYKAKNTGRNKLFRS